MQLNTVSIHNYLSTLFTTPTQTMDELKLPQEKVSHYNAEINQKKVWDASYNSEAFTKRFEHIIIV